MHSDPDHSFCQIVVLISPRWPRSQGCQNKIKNSKSFSFKKRWLKSRHGVSHAGVAVWFHMKHLYWYTLNQLNLYLHGNYDLHKGIKIKINTAIIYQQQCDHDRDKVFVQFKYHRHAYLNELKMKFWKSVHEQHRNIYKKQITNKKSHNYYGQKW